MLGRFVVILFVCFLKDGGEIKGVPVPSSLKVSPVPVTTFWDDTAPRDWSNQGGKRPTEIWPINAK